MAFKVLLVEDDNNLREIYEARLQAEGYDIVTARDGEEALGVAKAEVPDLVISDVMMPRVSGFEMLDILRNTDTLKDVKVIMLTALGQADDKTRANSLGADRYLVKSQVTLEDIVKTAHELLGDLGDSSPDATAAPAPSATPTAPAPTSTPVVPAPSPTPVVAPTPVAPAPVIPAPTSSPITTPPVAPAPPAATPPTTFSPTVSAAQPLVAPAPPQVMPTPAAPTPAIPLLPGAAPAVAPLVAPMPTLTPVAPAAPSTREEQATVASQINNFVQTAPDTTPIADPASPATQDDAVLADAMHDLAESTQPEAEDTSAAPTTPQPSSTAGAPMPPITPVINPAPAASPLASLTPAPATPPLTITPRPMTQPNAPQHHTEPENKPAVTGSVPIANKKVIQPLTGAEVKPDINELAAREEANSTAAAPAADMSPSAATSFNPTVPTPPTPPAGPVVGGPGTTPPAPQSPETPPASSSGLDPNSISL